jgi:hypothetical protein
LGLDLREIGTDHLGRALPDGVSACVRQDSGAIVSFKVRWRQLDEQGRSRQPSKAFSVRKAGSPEQALLAASSHNAGARQALAIWGARARMEQAESVRPDDVFDEWLCLHGPELSKDYVQRATRLWRREIAPLSIAQTPLARISSTPSLLVRAQDELVAGGLSGSKRREIWKLFRAVLRWGRRRHADLLTVDVAGLIQLPKVQKSRLAFAADAFGLERIIEAILHRRANDDLLPLRDAALVAAMGYTIAARPSEWRHSVTWGNLFDGTVELQRAAGASKRSDPGLKTGARVALLLANGRDRVSDYRCALEERFGSQPEHGLVFQTLGPEGPVWRRPPGGGTAEPVAWDMNSYNRWVARIWAPARLAAAQAPDSPQGLEAMRFYDCRHTAISMALHSTLVTGAHGMNLHRLASWAGHDIQTLERHYRHLIGRYMAEDPIDIEEECALARAVVESNPFEPIERPSPQRAAIQRRRARATAHEGPTKLPS